MVPSGTGLRDHPGTSAAPSPDTLARLAAVRVRTIQLRILAGALTALWALAFVLVLVGYRPGGPVDILVGLAAALPILVALAAMRWPPLARGERAFAGIVWLGLGAVLLLVPSLAGLVIQLETRGPQTLLPSPEAAYPWILALVGTAIFAGLGIARRQLGETAVRRRRLARGTLIGAAAALIAAGAFGGAALANELALRDRVVFGSRFGPTDPNEEPPLCDEALMAGATSQVDADLTLDVDGRRVGSLSVAGSRSGEDVQWVGYVASEGALGRVGLVRLGDQAWSLAPGSTWVPTPVEGATGGDLDRSIVDTALTPAARAVAELHGIDVIEGARARHCRVIVTGDTFRRMAPEVALLIGDTDISRWLGELDFWVFQDGQLGRVEAHVNGSAGELADDAVQATLRLRMNAVDRGSPITIANPRS